MRRSHSMYRRVCIVWSVSRSIPLFPTPYEHFHIFMKAIAKCTPKTKRETLISGNRSLSFGKLSGTQADNAALWRRISRIFHILVNCVSHGGLSLCASKTFTAVRFMSVIALRGKYLLEISLHQILHNND